MPKARTETIPPYLVTLTPSAADDDAAIARALAIIEERMSASRDMLGSPELARNFLTLKIAALEFEVFYCIFLDSQNRLLACDEMFRGTLAQTSVYPREVVKAALRHNAAAVMFAHNHPSGVAEPSRADELLTQTLKETLSLVDVRTLDHFIVAGAKIISFAERGLI
jgi:DNA repair protein RadC